MKLKVFRLFILFRFKETLSSDDASNPAKIEASFKKFCKDLKTKENRFCYFLGGTADAATGKLIIETYMVPGG